MIGPEGDVTDMGHEGQAARLELIQPFLKPEELQAFKHMDYRGWRAKASYLHACWLPSRIPAPGNLPVSNPSWSCSVCLASFSSVSPGMA